MTDLIELVIAGVLLVLVALAIALAMRDALKKGVSRMGVETKYSDGGDMDDKIQSRAW